MSGLHLNSPTLRMVSTASPPQKETKWNTGNKFKTCYDRESSYQSHYCSCDSAVTYKSNTLNIDIDAQNYKINATKL